MKICKKCNLLFQDEFMFCKKCGGKLEPHQQKPHQQNNQNNIPEAKGNTKSDNNSGTKRKPNFIYFIVALVALAAIGFMLFKGNPSTGNQAKNDGSIELAIAVNGDRFGFIDKNGNWVIQPQFAGLEDFAGGLAAAKDYQTKKWGYIDKTGKWIIKPQYDGFLYHIYDKHDSNILKGYESDRLYSLLFYHQFYSHGSYGKVDIKTAGYAVDSFKSNTVCVNIESPETEKFVLGLERYKKHYKIINKKGDVVADLADQDHIDYLNSQFVLGRLKKGGSVIINKRNGKAVAQLPFESYRPEGDTSEATSYFDSEKDYNIFTQLYFENGSKDESLGYFNQKGETITSNDFKYVCDFSEGLAFVYTDEEWLIINESGKTIGNLALLGDPKAVKPKNYVEGKARVYVRYGDKKSMYTKVYSVDRKGNKIPNDFKATNGLAISYKDGKYGYVDENNNYIINPVFKDAFNFNGNGVAVVKGNNGFGLINTKGEFISKDDYDFITHFSCGLAIASKGINCEFLNEKGQVAIPGKYIFARPFKKYSKSDLTL